MNTNLNKDNFHKKAHDMHEEYQKFLISLDKCNKEQTEIINKFVKNLEEKKIQEIRNKLK